MTFHDNGYSNGEATPRIPRPELGSPSISTASACWRRAAHFSELRPDTQKSAVSQRRPSGATNDSSIVGRASSASIKTQCRD